MANRKVLINRHTTGNTAPNAAEMFHGEIAVAHKTGEEILWTKNNANEMVPFISCAQTIAIIDSKVQASEDDVVAATGETHIQVATGGSGNATVWTLSTDDIQSQAEFEAYSAATDETIKENYNTLSGAIDDVLEIMTTAVYGEGVINVAPNESGAVEYTVSHKTAHETEGFKKIKTDAYGHIVASSAVTTEDIQALGFKTSAETGADLEALSASVVTNKTNIEALSAGTQHDIEALSGDVVEYVKVVSGNIETVINELSAGTVSEFNSAFTAINALSADTEAAITAAIEGLDSSISASSAGKYFTALAIEDGKLVAKEEADIPVLSVESAGTGNVVSQITVQDHKITYQTASVATSEGIAELSAATIALSAGTVHDLEELSGATQAISGYAHDEIAQLSGATEAISGYAHDEIAALSAGTIQLSADTVAYVNQLSGYAHGEITELSGAVQANETDIDNLSAATLGLSAVTLTGVSLNNTPLTVTDHVVSVPVTTSGSGIANATESGSVADALAVKEYVQNTVSSAVEYKGATNDVPAGTPVKGDLWIASSAFTIDGQNAEVGDFIIYDGEHWQVIEKNLDGAITGNLTQDTVTLGDSTNSVKSLANGSNDQVLTMVNGAPAWADDPELTVVSAGTGNVLTDITVDDHEITFTKGVTAAADADLQALSGAVEDFSGATDAKFIELSAYTKDVDDKVKALSAGTIQLSADTVAYVDAQIDEVYASGVSYTDAKVAAEIALLDSVGSASTTGHYLTSVTITDGKITAVGEEEVPAATPVSTVNGTTGDTASAVLTGITTGGTDGHQLTLNATNKIFSAETSDSAITSVSAQTSVSALTSESALTAVHADAAAKVDSALTIEIVDANNQTATTVFDGSANQTITITNTDTATTEAGHYTPATAASAFTAPAGSFLSGVSVDSKNHVLEVAYADKVNSATTSESADTAAVADKVANALSISGYSDSSASTLDTAVAYDGSAAQSLTFGTVGNAGLNSMTMTSTGVVDVDVIDCGEY